MRRTSGGDLDLNQAHLPMQVEPDYIYTAPIAIEAEPGGVPACPHDRLGIGADRIEVVASRLIV